MKTLANLLILLFGLSTFGFAQTEKPITKWVQLDKPDDEFSLQVPEGFEFGMPGLPFDKVEARGEFHSESDRFFLFIDAPKKRDQRKQVEAFMKYSKQDTSDLNLAEHVSARAGFEDATGYYHRVIFIKTQSRIFTLQTVSLTKNSENAMRFLNSFRLQPKTGSVVADSQPESVENTDSDADPVLVIDLTQSPTKGEGRGVGTGTGTGQGSGSGAGYGSAKASPGGTATPVQTPPKITAPLKITYKHKAQYTDFARFYSIQGTVTLRVTFLATGEIGSIVPIKKLPFGLTESSAFAASQMKFEPETANGIARNTARPVVYAFNIY